MTYGLYAAGASEADKRKAIEAISYSSRRRNSR